jgi:nitroimidazol reductase NimA-like FMN-containing flavoprotein (pyridoxamine 5'-phosphate oxidase superfamily)
VDEHERDAFLAQPWIGALAATAANGSPLIVPIWYRWDGQAIHLWTDPAFPWVRRVTAEPRVAFTVFEHDPPWRAVYLRGTATIRQGSLAELRDEIRAIVARYRDPADVERTIDAYDRGEPKAIVTIRPSSIRAHVNLPQVSPAQGEEQTS